MGEKFLGGSGGSLANGLNFKESIKGVKPESLGMGTKSKKKNQVPIGPVVGTSKRK